MAPRPHPHATHTLPMCHPHMWSQKHFWSHRSAPYTKCKKLKKRTRGMPKDSRNTAQALLELSSGKLQ